MVPMGVYPLPPFEFQNTQRAAKYSTAGRKDERRAGAIRYYKNRRINIMESKNRPILLFRPGAEF